MVLVFAIDCPLHQHTYICVDWRLIKKKFPENFTVRKNINALFAGPGGCISFSTNYKETILGPGKQLLFSKFSYYPVHKIIGFVCMSQHVKNLPCRYWAGITVTSCSPPLILQNRTVKPAEETKSHSYITPLVRVFYL